MSFKKHHKKGQAMVEFALIAPLFFVLVFGMIDWGMYFFSTIIIETSVRDACRYGITLADWASNETTREQEIQDMVKDRCQHLLPGTANPASVGNNTVISYLDADRDPTGMVNQMEYLVVSVVNQPYTSISPLGASVPNVIGTSATLKYER